jgi:hypothetical protein
MPYSSSLKNLGLVIDNRFLWHAQASFVHRKVDFVLSRAPLATWMRLVQFLKFPLLLCCYVIHSQSSAEVTQMLNVAFNSCASYVYRIPSTKAYREHFFDLRKTMLMYIILTTQSLSYLFIKLMPARSSHTMNLVLPPCNTTH